MATDSCNPDDDNAAIPSKARLDQMGTIQLDFFRGMCHGIMPWNSAEAVDYRQYNESRAIHEKAKKAGTHQVQYVLLLCY